MTMKYYIKSRVFILFLIILTGLILVWTTRGKDDSTIASLNNVIQYIRSDKREKVADMIAYPITVTTNNGRMIFATKKEFLEHYDQIIDQTIIAGAEKEFTAFWLVGCDNIGIIDGRVRLVYSEDEIEIIAISNKTQY